MTRNNTFGIKAIVGIVLMLNLVCVPFTNAALAEGNNKPVPYTPETTPAWSFGSAEDGAGVTEVAAGVMGVVGAVGIKAEVERQPEAEDHVLKNLLDFHEQIFEIVFGRAYDEDAAGYLFEQPLDESTYGTVVFGWNIDDEPVDAMVLYASPIDVSGIEPDEYGTQIISAAHIAGTLEGVGKQGFWGISLVYDDSEGHRYNDLFLLSELATTTEEAFMLLISFLEEPVEPGDPCEVDCIIDYQACMDKATSRAKTCAYVVTAVATACAVGCGATTIIKLRKLKKPNWKACMATCAITEIGGIAACVLTFHGDADICSIDYWACIAKCRK